MANEMQAAARGDFNHDPDRGPERVAIWMVFVIALVVVTAIAWACLAQLDVAVQATGVVETSSRVAEVQSLEGGIVRKLLIHPGQAVHKGDLLVQLDTAQYAADVGENRQEYLAALAGLARTDALLAGTPPRFDPAWKQNAPALIDKEMELWREGQREFEATARSGNEAIRQRESELREAQSRLPSLKAALRPTEETFAIEERLFKEGAGARADYLAAQQRVVTQRSAYDAVRQSPSRLTGGLAQARP